MDTKFRRVKTLESQLMELDDFTDGESTSGYCDFDDTIPAEALVVGWECKTITPFKADTVYEPADGTTIAFVDGGGSADTITDSAEGFLEAGLQAGDTFTVSGATTAGNNKSMAAVNVEAGTITLATGTVVAAEPGVEGTKFTVTSTAAVSVGIDGDPDKYSANTAQSVAAAGTVGSLSLAADCLTGFSAAKTPRVTVTEGTHFGALDQGALKARVFYLDVD